VAPTVVWTRPAARNAVQTVRGRLISTKTRKRTQNG
jgi:hypothetical protein